MIDAHHHFWHYDAARHAWITDDMKAIRRDFLPGDLQPLLEQHDIDGSVVVQVDQTEDETLSLLSMSNHLDFIKGVVGWIDLRNPDVDSRLAYFSSLKKLKGFRHIVQAERPGFLLQPDFIKGVQRLARYGLTYDLLVYHYQLEDALEFVRRTPETKIVIDHLAKPSIATQDRKQWEIHMREMAELPNVYSKVSGMVTEARWQGWKYNDFVPYLDAVMNAFGTGRLMYGSDWPVCLVAASYEQQFSIIQQYLKAFSAAEKNQILGGNARRFYNL
jgi:L-fuconolactonase